MNFKKLQFWIPLLVIGGILLNCWVVIISEDYIPTWRHYLGLLGFVALMVYAFINQRTAKFMTGFYLIAGCFGLFAITPEISRTSFGMGPISTPPVQMIFFWVLLFFALLNLGPIINYYLDSKEAANAKRLADRRKSSGSGKL